MAEPTIVSSLRTDFDYANDHDTPSLSTQPGDVLIVHGASACFNNLVCTQTGATWTPVHLQCAQNQSIRSFESTGGVGSGAINMDNASDNWGDWGYVLRRARVTPPRPKTSTFTSIATTRAEYDRWQVYAPT